MEEGWFNDDYLILFMDQERAIYAEKYGLAHQLPAYGLIGIIGWDEFIVQDHSGKLYTVPTVPVSAQFLKILDKAIEADELTPDTTIASKIKWYVQPLVFGGDASSDENTTWLDIDQHAEAVVYWNKLYVQQTAQQQ